jgi:RNA polymerase sigma factor (sigma-70 family)
MNPTIETHLWLQIDQQNLTAQHALVTGHQGLVFDLAKKYFSRDGAGQVPYSELVSEGNLALCEAVDGYQGTQPDCRFSTYAYRRIEAALISRLRTDGLVARTEWQARTSQEARRNFTKLTHRLDRPPTVEEFIYVYGEHQGECLQQNCYYVELELGSTERTPEPMISPPDEGPVDDPVEAMGTVYVELPMASRMLVTALSGGATVGEVALQWERPREEIMHRLAGIEVSLCVS